MTSDENPPYEKFDQLWEHVQNGYDPPIYEPESAGGIRGRNVSLLLGVHFPLDALHKSLEEVADRFRHIAGLRIMPANYRHITVKWLGFVAEKKEREADIDSEKLDLMLREVEKLTSQISEFTLKLGPINALDSFVILEVRDGGIISKIQNRFHKETKLIPKYPLEGENWLPHLSIAGVAGLEAISELKTEMEKLRSVELGEIKVTQIDLMKATLQRPSPICQQIASFPLKRKSQ